jgi:hypothetical protein
VSLDPEDEELIAELSTVRYFRTSAGKIQIESKDAAKKRGVGSPNRGDALMLAFAESAAIGYKPIRVVRAVWG